MTDIFERLKTLLPVRRAGTKLSALETDATFSLHARSLTNPERDRYPQDLHEVLEQSLEAWRANPLARRVVALTTQYVVGGGIAFTCKHRRTNAFLREFWEHPLNHLDVRAAEWCDELSRTGNLFLLLSSDAAGMSYLRAVPASAIERIDARPNDIEQPLAFFPKPTLEEPDPAPWLAFDAHNDQPAEPRMLHFAINRPVGAQWGEPDLAPVLRWLSRYAAWLEDRARLNRFRNAFLFVVRGRFASESARLARQQQLNAVPPSPGSILVCDEGEEWRVISPALEASDANTDGLALKKMIAAGTGVPLHFLAEPESSTRTTAEAAGGPTFRHFEQRQRFFVWVVKTVLRAVVDRRARFDRLVNPEAVIEVSGSDISARDNAALASAASASFEALEKLRDRGLVDDAELLRLVYRFAGESADVEEMLRRGEAAPAPMRYDLLRPSGGSARVSAPSVGGDE